MINMTREELLVEVCKAYGFENEYSIRFAEIVDNGTDEEVEQAFVCLMDDGIIIDDEDF
jgi:hypothetical protein